MSCPSALLAPQNFLCEHHCICRLVLDPLPFPRPVEQEREVAGLPTRIEPRQSRTLVEVVSHRRVRNIEASDVTLQRHDVRDGRLALRHEEPTTMVDGNAFRAAEGPGD